jgi:hypothetical protein
MSNVKSLIRISAGLLVLGSIGLAAQAQAQTVDMPFDGNVPGSCTFGTVTPGVLVRANGPGVAAVMATGGGTPIGGGPGVGTASKVTVTCTAPSVLSVAVPTGSGPVGFTPGTVQTLVQRATGGGPLDYASATAGPNYETIGPWSQTNRTMTLNAGPTPLNVNMVAGFGNNNPPPLPPAPLPTGNYSYKVNLSITGN